mgnify:CR=1 FL=1
MAGARCRPITSATVRPMIDSSVQPHVRAYRQVGLTGSVEFKPSGADRWPTDTRAGYRVALAARRHGLVIRPLGDSILFVPPISIQADEVKHLVRAVRLAMDEVLSSLPA